MLFTNIAVLDEDFNLHKRQWVGTKNGRIEYLSAQPLTTEQAAPYGDKYEGAGKLLIPGFYNAHSHAPMTLLRGYAESLPLHTWLTDRVFPFEAHITAEDAYWATTLAIAEMVRFGTVSFSDMYYHTRDCARAVLDAGMKCNICDTLIAPDNKPYSAYPLAAANREYLEEFHGAGDGRLLVDFNIHAEYTSHPTAVAGLAAAAKEAGVRIQLHASETRSEHEECKARHGGATPVQYFESLGVFEVPVTAAHCVWIEGEDFNILANRGATVACNPASNMKLGSGFAPVPQMLDAGINVALGTDGAASNNSLNIMRDMALMALVYKGAQQDPAVVTPHQALYAATRAGARSQGRADCGVVRLGAKADLCVLDTSGPNWFPATDPLANLVFAGQGSEVCLTMVDGQVLYHEGLWPTLDIDTARTKVALATKRIIAEVSRPA
ncbi:MAG: amidohydrolase [Raoultibacter sp.]